MTDSDVRIIASSASWIDPAAVEQLRLNATLPGIDQVVGLPDLHVGKGIAVGAAFWSSDRFYPHLVGSDIGCGMALLECGMKLRKFKPDSVERKLVGLDAIWDGNQSDRLSAMGLPTDLAEHALGTIGGGNHFAEILKIERIFDEARFDALGMDADHVWLMVHSGSRGLGHAILETHAAHHGTAALPPDSEHGRAYLTAHDDAKDWAVLNRAIIAERICEKLRTDARVHLDICHNSVTAHKGGWLHRKGAAPADRGLVVIPGSRGDLSYLVEPRTDNADIALQSLAHGAGRKWSRSDARAKLSNRFRIADLQRTALGSRVICEDRQLIYEEAPQAYKDIHRVIADLEEAGLVDIIATFRPLITYKTRRT